jgi:glycogenin
VTGDSYFGATPSPDRNRVKSVFPWEEKPRVMPARIFPDSDAPPPSLFMSPSSQSQTSTTTVPSTPETKGQPRAMQLSPLYGLPTSFNYNNAWDNIPSIQKYASRLVRAPPLPPPLAPAFDDSYRRGRRSLDERTEISSDGDDEDNADEDEDVAAKAAGDKWEDNDIDEETSRRRSRSNSVLSAATRHKSKKKEYRHRGVQTVTIETRSQGVQVDRPSRSEREKHGAKLSLSSKRHWAPTMGSGVLPLVMTRDVSSSSSSTSDNAVFVAESMQKSPSVSHRDFVVAPPSSVSPGVGPVALAKPRTKSDTSAFPSKSLLSRMSSFSLATPVPSSITPTHSVTQSVPLVKSPPPKSLIVTRQPSNDPSVGSPVVSIGPLSPSPVPVLSPTRKPGRVWDPARGVELFKRGSEEVLARFLKMGSWEEDSASPPQR